MTKMNYYLGLFFTASFLVFSCEPDPKNPEPATIELIIKGNFQGQPLVFDPVSEYLYFDGSKLTFTRSEFFINNLELVSPDGTHKSFGELKHIKLQDQQFTVQKAQEGYKLKFIAFAEGTYNGLKFDLGLTPQLNRTSPANYKSGHVLFDGDNYWSGWDSYIFSKTEGSITDNKGKNAKFAYHSGFDEALRKIHINKPIVIKDGAVNTITIELDHSKIFGDNSNYINIFQNNIIHEGTDFINLFMNQFSQSFN